MELLRKVASFDASEKELKLIYFAYVRCQIEKSATVWHSSLTEENKKKISESSENGGKNNTRKKLFKLQKISIEIEY